MLHIPKVSVIVPIYNVEKYLRPCLDSIVGQTLKEIEIILINDGSPDNSLAIIHEYAQKDARIKVIDKPNEGYGKTMNRGIDAATGEYIGIVESDDWIEPDMYETLYDIAKSQNVEVVKANYIAFDNETGKDMKERWMLDSDAERVMTPRQNPAIFLFPASIWSAIYRRGFLNNHEIRFLESPGASYQDTAFNFKVWSMAEKVYLVRKPVIHYRMGHSSQSVTNKDKVFCVCDEFKEIERYMSFRPELWGQLEEIFHKRKLKSYIWNLNRLEGENREAFRQRMQEEFRSVPINAIDMSGMTCKDRLILLKVIYPQSAWIKTLCVLRYLTAWLIKDSYRNGTLEIRILFGLIRFRLSSKA